MYVTDAVRIFYGIYLGLVCLFFVWFIARIRKNPRESPGEEPSHGMDRRELVFFGGLATVVVLAHIITLSNIVPWQKWSLWSRPTPQKIYAIEVADYRFAFPESPMRVPAGKFVEFDLTSKDVTYGFGVFRKDGTMVFQISVLPGHRNRYVWTFLDPGYYDVRSTEYSGARHSSMWVPNAILVDRE